MSKVFGYSRIERPASPHPHVKAQAVVEFTPPGPPWEFEPVGWQLHPDGSATIVWSRGSTIEEQDAYRTRAAQLAREAG